MITFEVGRKFLKQMNIAAILNFDLANKYSIVTFPTTRCSNTRESRPLQIFPRYPAHKMERGYFHVLKVIGLYFSKLTIRQLTVGTTVTKNCEPLVLGPAFAMLRVYGRSCLSVVWNSSSNSPPQMLSPPMPVPVGSPVWIMKLCTGQGDKLKDR